MTRTPRSRTKKTALLTGVTGQDGSYLTELLLAKGYEVHGIIRRASTFNTDRIDHLYQDPHEADARLFLHYGDLSDSSGLRMLVERVQPDEVYNLGAQSHVKVSFDQAEYTADITGLGTLRLLEAIRDYRDRTEHHVKYYQASSSEMFGAAKPPQGLHTPFHPRSPYAVAKVYSYWQTINHREAYGLYACNGILFNHESPRRGETFVTRKITRAVGRIKMGLQKKLYLGNLEAKRDWGHARDYVEAMWMMLQQDAPRDYVIATGEAYSVREFAERAFEHVGLRYEDYVEVDPRYFRPAEVDYLLGDMRETSEHLGWTPKTSFEQLVTEMVEHDLELARQEKTLIGAGHQVALKGIGAH
ncbi:GDP-mannose 4,6-dehydratase [Deinococcus yavapaiensis]|uniref:GDP-mannose 4,6-dehydratase n=1 Tax=Deinococcus yavapaiensis KR-236 TaxID=694435 RepID=A0A318SA46_9DEIO|nr:GDP-mannose 4,6-dehydratase [Deinococcus yavapaiensis]PYE55749.1 GDPmannose 4,6-dehydratase [Deinococcus yavapaiensis KR-236]